MVFPCDTSLMAVELKWNKQKCRTFKRTWGININKAALNLIIWCVPFLSLYLSLSLSFSLLCVRVSKKIKWNKTCVMCWLNSSEWMRWITRKHTNFWCSTEVRWTFAVDVFEKCEHKHGDSLKSGVIFLTKLSEIVCLKRLNGAIFRHFRCH